MDSRKKYKSRSKSPSRERLRESEKRTKLKRKESSRDREKEKVKSPLREKKKARLHARDGNEFRSKKQAKFDLDIAQYKEKKFIEYKEKKQAREEEMSKILREEKKPQIVKEKKVDSKQVELNDIREFLEAKQPRLEDADEFDIVSKNEMPVQSSEDSESSSSDSDSTSSTEESDSSSSDELEPEVEVPEEQKNPHNFRQFLSEFAADPCNTLFYEPSGCAKELMAEYISSECKTKFINVKGPELMNKSAIKKVFEKARSSAPCILFFQDLEYIARYPSIIFSLYSEIKISEESEIYIVGVIKYSGVLPAFLVHLKFQKFVYVPLPDPNWREMSFKFHLKDWTVDDKDMQWLVKQTAGFTLFDIKKLSDCVTAFNKTLNEYNETLVSDGNKVEEEILRDKFMLTKDDFDMALKLVQSTFSENDESLHSKIFIQLVGNIRESREREQNDQKRRQKILSIYESVKKMKKENKSLIDHIKFIGKILTPVDDSGGSYLDKEIERRMKSSMETITNAKSAFKEIESKLFDLAEYEIP